MGGFWEAREVYKDFVKELSTRNRYFINERFLQIFDTIFENGENKYKIITAQKFIYGRNQKI